MKRMSAISVNKMLNTNIWFAAAMLLFSISCETDDSVTTTPERFFGELMVDGRVRSYLINIPAGSTDARFPVVFMFHGTGGSAAQAEKHYGWTDKSNKEKFIIVYPEGVLGEGRLGVRTWNAGRCCQYAMQNAVDDIRFVNLLLDNIVAHYAVDETKIYAAGMSNGAMLTYRIACELSGRIAAFASVSGTMMVDEPCSADTPIPFLHIHSRVDHKVPYSGGTGLGGYYFTAVDSALHVIKSLNGCQSITRNEYPMYTHEVAEDCSGSTAVELYLLDDGGHSWPGGQRSSSRSDPPSTTINATDIIWDFFRKHERR